MREILDKTLLYDTLFINVITTSDISGVVELKNCDCAKYTNLATFCDDRNLNIGNYCERNLFKIPEYAKIVAITYGTVTNDGSLKRDIKYLSGDEFTILKEFAAVLDYYYVIGMKSSPQYIYPICGLNINDYELPFLFKKFIKYKLEFPDEIVFPNIMKTINDNKIYDNCFIDIMKNWSNNNFYPSSMLEMCGSLGLKVQEGVCEPYELNKKYWDLDGNAVEQAKLIKTNTMNYLNVCIQYLNKLRQI